MDGRDESDQTIDHRIGRQVPRLMRLLVLGLLCLVQFHSSTAQNQLALRGSNYSGTLLADIYQCNSLQSGHTRRMCLAHQIAEFAQQLVNVDVLDYFYKALPYPGVRFRSPACVNPHHRGGRDYGNDIVWERDSLAPKGDDCLWGNMAFSKSIFILLLARALGVTHVVESGRMGGMSLVHYAHFGLRVHSIEFHPLESVKQALRRAIPSATIDDGDGTTLVPAAIANIHRDDPHARILCIIDGPKGSLALQLARKIRNDVAMIVLDDQGLSQTFREEWPFATAQSNDKSWRALFPMKRDLLNVTRPPNPAAFVRKMQVGLYFQESDVATALLGALRPLRMPTLSVR